jgi:uncharacterized protein (DUF779 family)
MSARRPWLYPLVPAYATAIAAKNMLRRAGLARGQRLAWPVLSVGSLSAGGAGKTPVVIALASLLRARGWHVDILSRGYGRTSRGVARVEAAADNAVDIYGDEPVLLAERTGAPVWVSTSRYDAAQRGEKLPAVAGGKQSIVEVRRGDERDVDGARCTCSTTASSIAASRAPSTSRSSPRRTSTMLCFPPATAGSFSPRWAARTSCSCARTSSRASSNAFAPC